MGSSLTYPLEPMEAKSVSALPQGKNWLYEPKWDGFRCVAFRDGELIQMQSKSGKPLERYFPDIVAALASLKAKKFVVDGELLIQKDTAYSFSELQLRLHPAASRVKKLAAQAPATFMLFDLLGDEKGAATLSLPFAERRARLTDFFARYAKENPRLALSPQVASLTSAESWIKRLKGVIDGLIAKPADAAYQPGQRLMQKYKFLRTADCVVGGFRYATNSRLLGSLLLGLYTDKGLLDHVGFTSAIPQKDKQKLTQTLKKLIAPPGFTGRAPSGPSRWSAERSTAWEPLKPELVVEVGFDHVTGGRFRHGTRFLRWRPDKSPLQCTMDQLDQPLKLER
ncbi:MAG: ATP-dependent DNA ligase [Pseudomonadota bacterium]|nr:ATP-dependent DNA ligase [Pseudomonadota bacterium]